MAAPTQLVGHMLGHYRIIEQIGAGGMGVVYRAHDEQLERDVAIKILPVGTLTDEAARKRFRKEALALAKVNHPNIATIFEFSSQNSTDYLVTEYIPGRTLDAKLATGALSEKEVVGLGIQLAQGLSAAHEHGIVHRDLKPANLRLTSDARVKILDFGLAQLMPHASELGLTATLTQSQEVTGTLPYMAPEQLRAGVADARSDIWAAGAVLYEMATAHRPFEEKMPTALIDDIIHKTPLSPRSLKPTLSPELAAVILKCLEKEPTQRYQSARDLEADLDRLSTGVSPLAARPRLWPIIAASAIVVVMFAVGAFLSRHRSPRLTEKDTIVLADFTNSTDDPVFEGTLRQGLMVQLEQSPFLSLVSEQHIRQTLRMMSQPADVRLTPEISRELCQRIASAGVVEGSIARLGRQYVLGLKATNCSGDTLAEVQERATGKEQVLGAMDKAAAKLRGKLGESLSMIEKFDTPLAQATTSSLEALQAFSLARRSTWEKGDDAAAVLLFQRAIQFDPNFATAYAALGASYINLDEISLAAENTRKAYELRARVSERERFLIESRYYHNVTGDLEKARRTYELWAQIYPRDWAARNSLGMLYLSLGQYGKALAEFRASLDLDPSSASAYDSLVCGYLYLNRLEEARATAKEGQAKTVDSPWLRIDLYQIAFLQNDSKGMAQQVAWSAGKPGVEDVLLAYEADTAAYHGQLGKAREFSRRAVASAEHAQEKETAAAYQAEASLSEALFGNGAAARELANAARLLSMARDVQYRTALALAFAGDVARAQALADDLAKRFRDDTIVQFNHLPTIQAQLALKDDNASKAIERVQAASLYELGFAGASNGFSPNLYPVYVRGQAYLALRKGIEAAAEFQKILDHPGVVLNEPIGALARVGLGRAYAFQGDNVKARSAYQDFLALWKDADPDIPILKQAKAEYAKLQ
jgi:eukaryotic-like serine/threonine-protein kinase